jgi:hypothetical protein
MVAGAACTGRVGLHDGRYPDALSQLTPDYLAAAPVDPFDGQSLRYRKEAAGYLLYSIGPDLRDDSGWRMHGNDGDIVFAVVTPAKPDCNAARSHRIKRERPSLECGDLSPLLAGDLSPSEARVLCEIVTVEMLIYAPTIYKCK